MTITPIAPPSPFGTGVASGPILHDSLGGTFRPLRWFSSDGLALAGRIYGHDHFPQRVVLCLPGLTRNARDFEAIAAHLASVGMSVIAAESRGRGQSQWDPSPGGYSTQQELADALALVDGLSLARISVIGTSRGGLLTMLMAVTRPELIARAVLNDIGPRVELGGLLKIRGYVGRGLGGADWATAVRSLQVSQSEQFPSLTAQGWERYARRLWRDDGGKPVNDYDPALALGLAGLSEATVIPELWEAFAALATQPVLVLRGALSDILAEATTVEMARRHSNVAVHTIADQGHAPFLDDEDTMAAIADFLKRP